MEETKIEIMTTLEQTLRTSHDWAVDRIYFHSENKNYKDAISIRMEFCEWMDPNIEEHDVFSLEYLNDM